MVKTLTQSIEQIDVNGQTWTQRRGSPSGGKNKENKKENAVVFIHGLGSRAYTFRQVSVLLQEKGYETFAPDVVGHGDSEKPSSNGGFKYDERSYVDAMETYVEKMRTGTSRSGARVHYSAIRDIVGEKRPDLFHGTL